MEANEAAAETTVAPGVLAAEAAALGLPPVTAVTSLTHNPLNMVTDALHRVQWDGGAAVRKVVTPGGQGKDHWKPSLDPRHWNYWRREADVYVSDLPSRLGLRAPKLLGHLSGADGALVLWLEAVEGVSGVGSTVGSLADAAAALGRSQGRAELPEDEFLSVGFIGDYAASKPVPMGLLHDDAAWQHPLVRDGWPSTIRSDFIAMFERRAELHTLLLDLPRTVAHLDVWPNNIITPPGGEAVFVDWAFCGSGAVGEDIGNLIPDAVLDLLIPAEDLDELEQYVLAAYCAGLAEAGGAHDRGDVEMAMMASAVKYYWLVPILLSRLDAEVHVAYGTPTDPVELYRRRGVALARLGTWARRALDALG